MRQLSNLWKRLSESKRRTLIDLLFLIWIIPAVAIPLPALFRICIVAAVAFIYATVAFYLGERTGRRSLWPYIDERAVALEESVRLQSHYAELLNMHDNGRRMKFDTVDAWISRLREVGKIDDTLDA